MSSGGGCSDTARDCAGWAERGECERNADFMGRACRLSCKLCEALAGRGPPSVEAT